jgi:lysophospholipid acyltransferase
MMTALPALHAVFDTPCLFLPILLVVSIPLVAAVAAGYTALSAAVTVLVTAAALRPTVARTLVATLAAYPTGALMPSLPHELRNGYSAIVGALLIIFVLRADAIHVFAPAALVLVTQNFVGLSGRSRLLASSLTVLGYLAFRHAVRVSFAADDMDETTLVMVLAAKLTSLAFNVYDGESALGLDRAVERATQARDAAALVPSAPAALASASRRVTLLIDRRARALGAPPAPLAFLGYALSFSSSLVGPAIDFADYTAAQTQADGARLDTRRLPAAWKLVQGLAWAAVAALAGARFNADNIVACAREGASPLALLLVALPAVVISRWRYYAVWKIAEGACVAAGFGFRNADEARPLNPAVADFSLFSGIDLRAAAVLAFGDTDVFGIGTGSEDWEGASNVDPLTVETRVDYGHAIAHWNKKVQQWLFETVHTRVEGGPLVKRWTTFAASALWHGFSPSYYMTFGTMALQQDAARALSTAARGRGWSACGTAGRGSRCARGALWVAQWALTVASMAYAGIPFIVPRTSDALLIYGRLWWGGHVAIAAAHAAALILRATARKAD